MPLLGLIGYPLSHSFSPAYFRQKFHNLGLKNWDYRVFPIEAASELPALIEEHPYLLGLNVTLPYKQDVLQYCDTISEDVKLIGACNCIKIEKSAGIKLKAYNTDHSGFTKSLLNWYQPSGKKALVMGTGGSAKAIVYALQKMGIDVDMVGRTQVFNYTGLRLKPYDLLVNCTPVGLKWDSSGQMEKFLPLPYNEAGPGMYYFDLIYNPLNTAMMELFAEKGVICKNGLEMLENQAEQSWEIFVS